MDEPHIVSTEVVERRHGPHWIDGLVIHRTGELLTMGDGSQWFHPYGHGQPVMERPPTDDRKMHTL